MVLIPKWKDIKFFARVAASRVNIDKFEKMLSAEELSAKKLLEAVMQVVYSNYELCQICNQHRILSQAQFLEITLRMSRKGGYAPSQLTEIDMHEIACIHACLNGDESIKGLSLLCATSLRPKEAEVYPAMTLHYRDLIDPVLRLYNKSDWNGLNRIFNTRNPSDPNLNPFPIR